MKKETVILPGWIVILDINGDNFAQVMFYLTDCINCRDVGKAMLIFLTKYHNLEMKYLCFLCFVHFGFTNNGNIATKEYL